MKISRRAFIKGCIGTAVAGAVFRPQPAKAANPRVIGLYDASATTYVSGGNWYSNSYVDQSRIDAQLREGVKRLTGQTTELDAWTALIPSVSGSTKIGIKVNENGLGAVGGCIDWLPQLVNAAIKGLKVRGFTEPNIYVMDPSGNLPGTLKDIVAALYPNISFWNQYGDYGNNGCTWTSGDSSLRVTHTNPSFGTSVLPDQLLALTYFIQMPIMKLHGYTYYTLTHKNLVGMKRRNTIDALHTGMSDASNNPLVDIYANTHFLNKTVLIVGDAIYGGRINNYYPPSVWEIFGNDWPKMVFVGTDPVAVDSVMWDYINWQAPRPQANVLVEAASRGQGVHDTWNNPTQKQYANIDYVALDMASLPPPSADRLGIDRKIRDFKAGSATEQEVKDLINEYMETP